MNNARKQIIALAAALAMAFGISAPAMAVTPAGTVISTFATMRYTVGAPEVLQQSNIVQITVAELLAHTLTWQDASPINSVPGALSQVATFRLENTGNGMDTYALMANTTVPGDDFEPDFAGIYIDDGNGTYGPEDTLYKDITNALTLNPAQVATVFLIANIPQSAQDAFVGLVALTSSSTTGSGPRGTIITGGGDGGGIDAVVGLAGGSATEAASYVVEARLVILKSASVLAPSGGTDPVSGAVVTYTLAVHAAGTDPLADVVINDTVPDGASYNTGSMRLDGTALTDAADGLDAADFGASMANTVTVGLGGLEPAGPAHILTFSVTIR